jgi:hypothetical protein
MIDVVGNNADNFSALWATTLKICWHCQQQRGLISTTWINGKKLRLHCKPLKQQQTQNKSTSQYLC